LNTSKPLKSGKPVRAKKITVPCVSGFGRFYCKYRKKKISKNIANLGKKIGNRILVKLEKIVKVLKKW
jgi:hypothetical protein